MRPHRCADTFCYDKRGGLWALVTVVEGLRRSAGATNGACWAVFLAIWISADPEWLLWLEISHIALPALLPVSKGKNGSFMYHLWWLQAARADEYGLRSSERAVERGT